MAQGASEAFPNHEYDIPYSGVTRLNTLDIHTPRRRESSEPRYWVVYIHGGAWRDPSKTSRTILATLPHLSDHTSDIAGIASLNYRLSAYPDHPRNPSSEDDPARNVRHPEHVEDVLTAIAWLQEKHHFGERYVLVGHSCGATLALQAVTGEWSPKTSGNKCAQTAALPLAVVGLEGIYDLQALLDSYAHVPLYKQFVESAFGENKAEWARASPVNAKLKTSWPNAKAVVLAHSRDDELVNFLQTERMSDQLWKEKREGRRDMILSVSGKHDEIWQDGSELAKAIITALQMVQSSR